MRGVKDPCLLSSPFSSKSAGDGGGGEVERLKSRIRKAGDHARVSTGWRILPLCQPLACMYCEGYISLFVWMFVCTVLVFLVYRCFCYPNYEMTRDVCVGVGKFLLFYGVTYIPPISEKICPLVFIPVTHSTFKCGLCNFYSG